MNSKKRMVVLAVCGLWSLLSASGSEFPTGRPAVTLSIPGPLPEGVKTGAIVDVIAEWDSDPKISLTIDNVTLLAATSGADKSEITFEVKPNAPNAAMLIGMLLLDEKLPKAKLSVRLHHKLADQKRKDDK